MMRMIRFFAAAPLALPAFNAAGTEAQGIQHEIEVFLSTGFGTIVFIILTLLFLLWLLLPLAVFGLKSKLKTLISETRETNRILADIRREFTALEADDADENRATWSERSGDKRNSEALYEEIRFDP